MTAQTATEAFKLYEAAFSAKYRRDEVTGCHVWTAQVRNGGYGGFRMGREQLAHRAAVILSGRKIPSGMVVDHVCRNRLCVNPDHLRIVSARENTLENSNGQAAINAAKSHCKHGHPLAGPNLIKRNRGGRDCRTCLQIRQSKKLADGMVSAIEAEAANQMRAA